MKWKHTKCLRHISVGVFDGKRMKKVCVLEGDSDEDVERVVRFAEEISSQLSASGGA